MSQGLLDILEHSPEEAGRIAAVKALTTMAISSSCREIMTGRGLMPILDMLRDEVSTEYGAATGEMSRCTDTLPSCFCPTIRP